MHRGEGSWVVSQTENVVPFETCVGSLQVPLIYLDRRLRSFELGGQRSRCWRGIHRREPSFIGVFILGLVHAFSPRSRGALKARSCLVFPRFHLQLGSPGLEKKGSIPSSPNLGSNPGLNTALLILLTRLDEAEQSGCPEDRYQTGCGCDGRWWAMVGDGWRRKQPAPDP